MNIGDVEYTQKAELVMASGGAVSERVEMGFATGLKVRPLLTRMSTTAISTVAITNQAGVWFENGRDVGAGASIGTLITDQRTFCLYAERRTLVTSGYPIATFPMQTLWWKILMPSVTFHYVLPTDGDVAEVIVNYRWAELTDNEIVEIAAQRSN